MSTLSGCVSDRQTAGTEQDSTPPAPDVVYDITPYSYDISKPMSDTISVVGADSLKVTFNSNQTYFLGHATGGNVGPEGFRYKGGSSLWNKGIHALPALRETNGGNAGDIYLVGLPFDPKEKTPGVRERLVMINGESIAVKGHKNFAIIVNHSGTARSGDFKFEAVFIKIEKD